jgi:hypothetical protein
MNILVIGSDSVLPLLVGPTTTQQKSPKSVNFDYEVMEIGLVWSNLVEKAPISAILCRILQ